MSNQRFLKYIPSEKTSWLRQKHPNAFLLLSLIAERARRTVDSPDGYEIGECHIGDYRAAGIETENKYRTALQVLIREKIVKKVETCRTRKNSTTGTTTVGTKVKILKSEIWDLNLDDDHDRCHDRTTTGPRPDHDEQEGTRKNKKEKETTTPQTPLYNESLSAEVALGVSAVCSLEKIEDVLGHPSKAEHNIISIMSSNQVINNHYEKNNSSVCAVVVFPEKWEVSEDTRNNLVIKHGDNLSQRLIDHVEALKKSREGKENPIEDPIKYLFWCLNNLEKIDLKNIPLSPKDNKQLAANLAAEYAYLEKQQILKIEALPEGILFSQPLSPMYSKFFGYSEKNFEKKAYQIIEKHNKQKVGNL